MRKDLSCLLELLKDFLDPPPIFTVIKNIVESIMLIIPESMISTVFVRIMEDYKENPRLQETLNPMKGLKALVEKSLKVRSIVEKNQNMSALYESIGKIMGGANE